MYELELPDSLKGRQIHLVFHASKLQHHEKNDDGLFLHCEVKVFYDFSNDDKDEWLINSISGQFGNQRHWSMGLGAQTGGIKDKVKHCASERGKGGLKATDQRCW